MFIVTAAALLVVLTCIGVSIKRLHYATNPTALDMDTLFKALSGDKGRARYGEIRQAILDAPGAEWEREMVEAVSRQGDLRVAKINEQLAELDFRVQLWARVPRVCASISSSAGFLLAAMAMRIGLARIDMTVDEGLHEALNAAALDAIGIAALGMWGTVACVAIQAQARRAARDRLNATDKLVERIEGLAIHFS